MIDGRPAMKTKRKAPKTTTQQTKCKITVLLQQQQQKRKNPCLRCSTQKTPNTCKNCGQNVRLDMYGTCYTGATYGSQLLVASSECFWVEVSDDYLM